jgi:hypothetical protein
VLVVLQNQVDDLKLTLDYKVLVLSGRGREKWGSVYVKYFSKYAGQSLAIWHKT